MIKREYKVSRIYQELSLRENKVTRKISVLQYKVQSYFNLQHSAWKTQKRQAILMETVNKQYVFEARNAHVIWWSMWYSVWWVDSSTHIMETTMGNEGEWAKACLMD